MDFEPVIGLEVHAQLLTRSKIFCGCSTQYGAPANSSTCPVCLGLPGALPVLNREAVVMAIKAALSLGCRINAGSVFARKNYFYPDLPKGYQISQYDLPLAEEGEVTVAVGRRDQAGKLEDFENKSFRIHRLHLEEDAGKSVHSPGGDSLVNLNRTGVPLVEIVTEADFRSPDEAYDFLVLLRRTLLYLGVCDGNMEEGSLRCDANVSVRPVQSTTFGTKTEIKNLNSFRFVRKALEYEIERQIDLIKRGGKVEQETRLWDETLEKTTVMRTKEEAHDYRYFPEPDLLPVQVEESWLQQILSSMPELPETRRQRLVKEYDLDMESSLMLIQSQAFADFFEKAAQASGQPQAVYNWMVGDLTRELKRDGREIDDCPVSPGHLAQLIEMLDKGQISSKMAKDVFSKMYADGSTPARIVEEEGLSQISDSGQLAGIIDSILEAHPDKVEAYRGGKSGLIGFFVGQVMRETKGQANPQIVNQLLEERLQPAE